MSEAKGAPTLSAIERMKFTISNNIPQALDATVQLLFKDTALLGKKMGHSGTLPILKWRNDERPRKNPAEIDFELAFHKSQKGTVSLDLVDWEYFRNTQKSRVSTYQPVTISTDNPNYDALEEFGSPPFVNVLKTPFKIMVLADRVADSNSITVSDTLAKAIQDHGGFDTFTSPRQLITAVENCIS